MTTDHDDLSWFQDAYLDYLEDAREAPRCSKTCRKNSAWPLKAS